MTKSDHILVVDDDPEIRRLLGAFLERYNYRVTGVADGAAMMQALQTRQIDLIVLDLMLPGEDGISLCRRLRANSVYPVIMLTARGDAVERVVGLEVGADDYLPKPFDPRELVARIRSVLRRTRAHPPHLAAPRRQRFRFDGWMFDSVARTLADPAGTSVPLGDSDFRLLQLLLEHGNRVLTRDDIMELTVGRQASPLERRIDVQISRLRQLLRDDGREPRIIKTVRNQGYALAVPVEVV